MTRTREHFVGDVVAERFELTARLGSGGMGTVWQARDLLLEREVALKEIRSRATDDPAHTARLRHRVLQEARTLARIRHPNVVTIYEVLDRRPYPWLVMELVTGRSLRELVRADGPLTPAGAAGVGLDVLGALEAVHAAGLLHRDVKPGNVVIRADGSAVLTDFGIATVRDAPIPSATGDMAGSPEYMAPERLRGQAVGPASDLWSLGMLLYACVEGDNPVLGHSMWQTVHAVCEEPVPAPSQAGALTGAIEELLAREPEQRPSASRLAALLVEVVRIETQTLLLPQPSALEESTTRVAHAPKEPEPAPRRRRRNRLVVVLDAVVGLAVITATTALVLSPRDDDAPTPATGPSGTWIAELADIPHTTDPTERDRQLADLRRQVPGAVLVDSNNWASLSPGAWVVHAPEEFADGFAALAFCDKLGSDHCTARYLSHDEADRDHVCEADPTPDPDTCRHPGDRTKPAPR